MEKIRIYTCDGVRPEDFYRKTPDILDEAVKKLDRYEAMGYVIEFDNALELLEKLENLEKNIKKHKP